MSFNKLNSWILPVTSNWKIACVLETNSEDRLCSILAKIESIVPVLEVALSPEIMMENMMENMMTKQNTDSYSRYSK